MNIKNRIVCCSIALVALPVLESLAGPADSSVGLITTFDYPASVLSTQPQKISDQDGVIGVIIDTIGASSAFVRFPNGHYSAPLVDPPGSGNATQGRGINGSLMICGNYTDTSSGLTHGFFARGATFYDYDVPGSTFTVVLGLNNANDFCGSDIPASGVQSGFVSIGGVVTEFTVPDATVTLAYQINSSDQAAGYYIDVNGITHGYYRDSDGSIVSPIDPAGSTGTIVFGNNDNNTIVGRFADSAGLTHGFVFVPPDTYVTYDFPGSTFTSLNGINKEGSIVGRYLDNSGIEHGLFARFTSATGRPTGGTIPQRHSAPVSPAQALPANPAVAPAL
ncbi:MAG: hypothetical protein H0X40_15845 [Chthoniobacterales bacterium]|nr:hypothetical protein [Chthoniobacterales bacterium]